MPDRMAGRMTDPMTGPMTGDQLRLAGMEHDPTGVNGINQDHAPERQVQSAELIQPDRSAL